MSVSSIVFLLLLTGLAGVLITEFVLTRTNGIANPAIDRLVAGLPLIGPIAVSIAQTKFAHAFAALYGAGIDVNSALRTAAASSGSHLLAGRVLAALPPIERGGSIARALTTTNALSPTMLTMLSTGETTGKVDTLMECVAGSGEANTDLRLHQLTIVLGVIAVLIVGGIVGLIAVGRDGGNFLRVQVRVGVGFLQALQVIGYDGPMTLGPFKNELADLPSDEARLKDGRGDDGRDFREGGHSFGVGRRNYRGFRAVGTNAVPAVKGTASLFNMELMSSAFLTISSAMPLS